MAVAARDRHARLREAQLGPDHVHDALPIVVQPGQAQAEVAAVALERRHHVLGHHVQERALPVASRDDVVHGGERALRERHLPAVGAQRVERLRRRHFVDEVEADEELRLPGRQLAHGVEIPHLSKQCLTHVCAVRVILLMVAPARRRLSPRAEISRARRFRPRLRRGGCRAARDGRVTRHPAPPRPVHADADADARSPRQRARGAALVLDCQCALDQVSAVVPQRDAEGLGQVARSPRQRLVAGVPGFAWRRRRIDGHALQRGDRANAAPRPGDPRARSRRSAGSARRSSGRRRRSPGGP